jgi:6-phosphofructokinase 1
MVALQSENITTVPLAIAIRKRKQVPRDYDVIKSARDLGVSFGDE